MHAAAATAVDARRSAEQLQLLTADALAILEGEAIVAPVQLERGERALCALEHAGLFEPRPDGPATRGNRAERPKISERGSVTVTDHRVVFQGAKQLRVWSLERLGAVVHSDTAPHTVLQLADAPPVGITYPESHRVSLRWWLDIALRLQHVGSATIRAELQTQRNSGSVVAPRSEPAPTATVPAAAEPEPAPRTPPPAGWYPDPFRRHEHRWWDGRRWTEHASSGGRAVHDPLR